jgi:hypothetical protein
MHHEGAAAAEAHRFGDRLIPAAAEELQRGGVARVVIQRQDRDASR